jgi:hypothetical protein
MPTGLDWAGLDWTEKRSLLRAGCPFLVVWRDFTREGKEREMRMDAGVEDRMSSKDFSHKNGRRP